MLMENIDAMGKFLMALKTRQGFSFVVDWTKIEDLNRTDLINIIKEMIYGIESNRSLSAEDINNIYDSVIDELGYDYELFPIYTKYENKKGIE